VTNISVIFVGTRNAYLKFLNRNERQFRLHYVNGPSDTVRSRVRMAQAWE